MTGTQINDAARMWSAGYDTWSIARLVLGAGDREPIICRHLWRDIIPAAVSMRSAMR